MGDRTSIEWTEATWNPATGCTKVSPGCDHCYAETIAHRFAGTAAYPDGFAPTQRPERLEQPLRWTRPRRIFVCSMADLFHDDVPDDYIARVFAVMSVASQHTFQVLTKRHGRLRSLLSRPDFERMVLDHRVGPRWTPMPGGGWEWPLPNVWLGVSTEDQRWADIRIPALLDTPAAVRWISAEPLLGPIDAALYLDPSRGVESRGKALDWVVVGGESGRGARPMHPDWARDLRHQCAATSRAFLFKQWGEWAPDGENESLANGRRLRYERIFLRPDGSLAVLGDGHGPGQRMDRVGKKASGRELDRATHDGYPA